MKKILTAFIGAMVFGCALEPAGGESVATEELALPVQAAAPCIKVTCDQATCPGALTVSQTVPMGIGKVEVWDATQWGTNGAVFNGVPTTTVTQSPGSVVTRTTGLALCLSLGGILGCITRPPVLLALAMLPVSRCAARGCRRGTLQTACGRRG